VPAQPNPGGRFRKGAKPPSESIDEDPVHAAHDRPSVDATQRARILDAAGPGATFVEAKDPKRQAEEIVDTDVLFGRVSNETFLKARRLRYYQSIGAGVDAILTPDLVRSDVILASEKGGVGSISPSMLSRCCSA